MDCTHASTTICFKRYFVASVQTILNPSTRNSTINSYRSFDEFSLSSSFIPLFRYFDYHSGGVEMATTSNQIRAGQSVKRFTVTRRV